MRVEVINTGTELLLGSVVNTHLAWFAEQLLPLGLRINRQVTVPDGPAIRTALEEAFARAELVLVTGGLGPTSDDLTRDIAADLLGRELQADSHVADAIAGRFRDHGMEMPDRVRRQALVPEGAQVLPNENGTAPGLYFAATDRTPHLFLLPGPPRELKPMFTDGVLPLLRGVLPELSRITCRIYRVAGLGESQVEELVGGTLSAIPDLELGYCARPGEVDVRCIGPEGAVSEAGLVVLETLGSHVFGTGGQSLEGVVVDRLAERSDSVCVAESCTGGFLSHRLTNVPGASAVFLAGVTTYADAAKIRILGVSKELLAARGAVSREVAAAMAEGALSATGATTSLSTTGIAGPGGGTDEKPVGTVFIGCARRGEETVVERHRFHTDRETFKWRASQAALDLLRRRL